MNRHDIQTLQNRRGYPSLSILLPTHRSSPDNKQDPIVLKNLLTEANNRLAQEFGKRELEPLQKNLDTLVASIDFRYSLDGLALFVSADYAEAFHLPVSIKERVIIDETFATRDLVFALNRSPRYWVLALSEQPTRLYEGVRDSLSEIKTGGFPMIHGGPGGSTALPKGEGISKSAYEDERHKQFFREVDNALKQFTNSDPLPLLVVGVERWLAHFTQVSSHKDIAASLTGSHDSTPAHELGKLVWPLLKASQAQKRLETLERLDKAVSAQRYASGISEVWNRANEGRGELLLIEEDYHFPATLDSAGQLHAAADASAVGVIDDAVDEVIEKVLSMQGNVVFVDEGSLENHQHIALILRY